MKYFLGIDSGGTKTEFALADESGHIVGHALMGTTNYQQCGPETLAENLATGVEELLKGRGLTVRDIRHAFLGLAAYDEIKEDMKAVSQAVRQGLKGIAYEIAGDNVCGWAGSLAGCSGVNIVAGTGSIAYARNDAGQSARSGGWGHWFGGDEGSAYWIGCQLIQAFTQQSDGRQARTLLYDAVRSHYQLNDDFDFVHLIVNKWNMDRTKVAILSRFACELAQQGDPACLGIFDEAGRQLARIIDACVQAVPFSGEVLASYSGGVFKSGDLIMEPLRRAVKAPVRWVKPAFHPAIGAVILAMMASDWPVTPALRKNLERSAY